MAFSDAERILTRCGWLAHHGDEVRQAEMFLRALHVHLFRQGRDARPLIHEILNQLQRESRLRINRGVLKVLYTGEDFDRLATNSAENFEHVRINLYATLIGWTGEQRALATERRVLDLAELGERLIRESTRPEVLRVLRAAFLDEITYYIDQPNFNMARDADDAVGYYYTQLVRLRSRAAFPYAEKRPKRSEVKWHKLAPGLRHGVITGQYRFGALRANILEISPKKWRLRVVDAHELAPEKRNLQTLAKLHGAAFATGAGFALRHDGQGGDASRLGEPLGLLITSGNVLWPSSMRRTALLTDEDGKVDVWRVGLAGVRMHIRQATVVVKKVNPERLGPGEIGVFTTAFGKPAPATPLGFTVIGHKVTAIHHQESVEVPPNGLVVAVDPGPADPGPLTEIEPGDLVEYQLPAMRGLGRLSAAVAGGPALVTDGQRDGDLIADGFDANSPPLALAPRTRLPQSVAPRAAWGVTAEHDLIAVCVDGWRYEDSVGLSLDEMARLMRELGSVRAVNFAGGHAARMLVEGHYVDANEENDLMPTGGPETESLLPSAILISERTR